MSRPKGGGSKILQVKLSEAQQYRLGRLCEDSGMTEGEVIRWLIDNTLTTVKTSPLYIGRTVRFETIHHRKEGKHG